MSVDTQAVENLFPKAIAGLFDAIWNVGIDDGSLTTPRRLAYFLAQTAHETGGFQWLRELGGPNYFTRYDGRRDLGNNRPGDGYRFRGGGLLMLTGRHNFEKAEQALNLPLISKPELVETPEVAVRTATWFWTTHRCNDCADAGDFTRLTRVINGGLNGMKDRLAWLHRIEVAMDE